MNRRKYLASLGIMSVGGLFMANIASQPTISINTDLPTSIEMSDDILEYKNPHLEIKFDKFEIKEQNYFGAEPKYTIKARTIYDNSESKSITLVENESLNENNLLENITSKTHFVPLKLPNEIENNSINITLQFIFKTTNDDIGPFTKENTISLSENKTYLYENWSNDFGNWNTGGDTGGSGGSYNHAIVDDSVTEGGQSIRIYGDGNCASSPYDGTDVWAKKDIELDAGIYEIEYYSKVEDYGYYSVGSDRTANEGRVYLNDERIAMIEDMCNTDGCSTDWIKNKQTFEIDTSDTYEIKLQYSTGDCSDGYIFWDELEIRKID